MHRGTTVYPHTRAGVVPAPSLDLHDDDSMNSRAHMAPLLAASKAQTVALHRAARARQTDASVTPSTYVAPDARLTPFVPFPPRDRPVAATGVDGGGGGDPGSSGGNSTDPATLTSEEQLAELSALIRNPGTIGLEALLGHLRNALSKLNMLIDGNADGNADGTARDSVDVFLSEQLRRLERTGKTSSAMQKRDGLQKEFQRHVLLSSDRLWVFVRTLSGFLGDDVTSILTMADESAIKANKAFQEQKALIAKRVSEMQTKLVETIVGSMMKDSKLVLDKDTDGHMVVINGETRARLTELAKGDSGRPFFEANVAFQNLVAQNRKEDEANHKLTDLLSSLAATGRTMIESLEATLNTEGLSGGPGLLELSHPVNSLFVHIKPDAVAAIRNAAERLNVELGLRGVRRLALWELVEGGNTTLTNRFCDFVGHVLVQARSSTGVSAMYVSQASIITNAMQANVALVKVVDFATAYARAVPPPPAQPATSSTGSGSASSGADPNAVAEGVQRARQTYLSRSKAVQEQAVCSVLSRKRSLGDIEGPRQYSRRVNGVYLYGHQSATRFGRY